MHNPKNYPLVKCDKLSPGDFFYHLEENRYYFIFKLLNVGNHNCYAIMVETDHPKDAFTVSEGEEKDLNTNNIINTMFKIQFFNYNNFWHSINI